MPWYRTLPAGNLNLFKIYNTCAISSVFKTSSRIRDTRRSSGVRGELSPTDENDFEKEEDRFRAWVGVVLATEVGKDMIWAGDLHPASHGDTSAPNIVWQCWSKLFLTRSIRSKALASRDR